MDPIDLNRRTSAYLLTGVGVVSAVLPLAIGLAVGPWWVGVVLAFVVGGAVARWADTRADRVVLRMSGARPASQEQYQRLHNLVEGLCIAHGVPKPEIHVVDSDAADSFSVGRDPKHAALVVTSGLLEHLPRIELEGVIAHELAHVRQHDTRTSSLVALVLGVWLRGLASTSPVARLRERALGEHREALADAAGCQMTRYPPGLVRALEAMVSSGVTVASPPAMSHVWIGRGGGDTDSLGARIDLLREG